VGSWLSLYSNSC